MPKINNDKWLFIIGSPKSGTTAIYKLLSKNSNFSVSREKELHFFTRNIVRSSYYNAWTPSSIDKYYLQFTNNQKSHNTIKCDVSPSYMYSSDAIAEICDTFPKAKGVILIRNPLERAFSHYQMDFQKGFVKEPLLQILNNQKQHPQHYQQYIEYSKYSKYVERCVKFFGQNNLLIVSSKRLLIHPESVITDIESLFGVSKHYSINNKVTANEAFVIRHNLIKKLVSVTLLRRIYRMLPMYLRDYVRTIVTQPANKIIPTEDELTKLQDLLSAELSWYNDATRNEKIINEKKVL